MNHKVNSVYDEENKMSNMVKVNILISYWYSSEML